MKVRRSPEGRRAGLLLPSLALACLVGGGCSPRVHEIALDAVAGDYLFVVEVTAAGDLISLTPNLRGAEAPLPAFDLVDDGRSLFVLTLNAESLRALDPRLDLSSAGAVALVSVVQPPPADLEHTVLSLPESTSVHRLERSWDGAPRLVPSPRDATALRQLVELRLARTSACSPTGLTALEPWHSRGLRPLAMLPPERGTDARLERLTAIDERRVFVPAWADVYFVHRDRAVVAQAPGGRMAGERWRTGGTDFRIERVAVAPTSTHADGRREVLMVGGSEASPGLTGGGWRTWVGDDGFLEPRDAFAPVPQTLFRAAAIDIAGRAVVVGDGGALLARSGRDAPLVQAERLLAGDPSKTPAGAIRALDDAARPFVVSVANLLFLPDGDSWRPFEVVPKFGFAEPRWKGIVSAAPELGANTLLAFGNLGHRVFSEGSEWFLFEDLKFPSEARDCGSAITPGEPLRIRRDTVDVERAGEFVLFTLEYCDAVFWLRLRDRCVHVAYPPGKVPGRGDAVDGLVDVAGIGEFEVVRTEDGRWRVIALARDGALWTATWEGR
jgi:hypothetical protein